MSELEYDKNYAAWLTAAGITPPSNPINLKGVVHTILQNLSAGGGTGTVTSVSVATANGFGGTVATPTVTPAITLTTGVTGLLKGNGTGVSAAVASTDYIGPTSGSAIQKANGSGGLTAASAGTDYPATGVISAAGPIGTASSIPVITYNANGQLTAVTVTGTVGTVSAADTSIVVGGTGTSPTIATGTLDVIATQHPPAGAWSNNGQKITSQGSGVLATDSANLAQTGWIQDANAWTRVSNTTFTVSSITPYTAGVVIKWTESSTQKYGVVLSSTGTTVTLVATSDYVMAASPDASSNFYSNVTPRDLPSGFTWGLAQTGFASTLASIGKFSVLGGRQIKVSLEILGTSNATTFTVILPIPASALTNLEYAAFSCEDNTLWTPGYGATTASSTTLTFSKTLSGGSSGSQAWTASGGKGAIGQIIYGI